MSARGTGTRPAGAALALGLVLAAALTGALGALSRVPYGDPAEQAVLRLSWRVRGPRISECRTLTPDELDALPAHMRRPQVCEGRNLPYELLVEVDGHVVDAGLVLAAGARQDRPLYYHRQITLAPGTHHVRVRFTARRPSGAERQEAVARPAGAAGRPDGQERGAQDQGGGDVAPDSLALEGTFTLEPGGVALVTFDADRRTLVLRGAELVAGGAEEARDARAP